MFALSERELRKLCGSRIAFIPQSPMTALNGAISLLAHFSQAWKAHKNTGREALMARLLFLLGQVQLPLDADFLRMRPSQISVGQAQRVLIALALLHRPTLTIADEPTSAIDPVTQTQIIDLLKRLSREQGTTMLCISHDLFSVLQLCDNVSSSTEAVVLEAILALSQDGRKEAYAREIAAEVSRLLEARNEPARLIPANVGHQLKKLGLRTRRLLQSGNGLTFNKATMAEIQRLSAMYEMEVVSV